MDIDLAFGNGRPNDIVPGLDSRVRGPSGQHKQQRRE